MLALVALCVSVGLASAGLNLGSSSPDFNTQRGMPLSRAFAKPPNVASDLDCAIKKLAFSYASNLLVSVSVYIK